MSSEKIDIATLAQKFKSDRITRTFQELFGFDQNFTWMFVQQRDDDAAAEKIQRAVWYQGPAATGAWSRNRRDAALRITRSAKLYWFRKRNQVHLAYKNALRSKLDHLYTKGCTSLITHAPHQCSRCIAAERTEVWCRDRGLGTPAHNRAPFGCIYAGGPIRRPLLIRIRFVTMRDWSWKTHRDAWNTDTKRAWERELYHIFGCEHEKGVPYGSSMIAVYQTRSVDN